MQTNPFATMSSLVSSLLGTDVGKMREKHGTSFIVLISVVYFSQGLHL